MKSWEKRGLGSKTTREEGLEVGGLMAILKPKAGPPLGQSGVEEMQLLRRQWQSQAGFPEAFLKFYLR